MSAFQTAILQVTAGAVLAGVGMVWIAYTVGADRMMYAAVRHPLRSFEMTVATVILSRLPKPRKRTYRKGRHRK